MSEIKAAMERRRRNESPHYIYSGQSMGDADLLADAYLAEHPDPDNRQMTDLTQEQLQELRRRLSEYETALPAAIDNDEVGLAGPFDTLQQRLGVLLIGHARPLLSAAQRLLDIGKLCDEADTTDGHVSLIRLREILEGK